MLLNDTLSLPFCKPRLLLPCGLLLPCRLCLLEFATLVLLLARDPLLKIVLFSNGVTFPLVLISDLSSFFIRATCSRNV